MRVSYAAFLRVEDDGRHVLFHARSRPGAFAPPGGVFKYFQPGSWFLDRLGFRPERPVGRGAHTRSDLRGVLPPRAMRDFHEWFDSGAYREDGVECLERELGEALADARLPGLAHRLPPSAVTLVRAVTEGPYTVPGQVYRQERRFEIYDLVAADTAAAAARDRLVALAEDPSVPDVLTATPDDIAHGRCGTALIAPHTAYLLGTRRFHADLPPPR